jgi:uncharacterized peroxidase-related enzyme
MGRIKVVQYEEADNKLKPIYDELIAKRGKFSEVLEVQSLHPDSVKSHVTFYMDIMFSKTALTRAEKELIAVVVSVSNGCLYCQVHHGVALNAYWKDASRFKHLKKDYHTASLSEKEISICNYAHKLYLNNQMPYRSERNSLRKMLWF